MPLFFLCFIVFVIWFRVKMKQNKSSMSEVDRLFWEREARANFARKQDISQLDYFSPDLSHLPMEDAKEEQELALIAEVKNYADGKMLNLSGLSNTDIKEIYGAGNLDELSQYDQRFQLFLRSLSEWGNYLFEKKDFVRAKNVLEYSVKIGSDISTVYINLGKIYAKAGNPKKIDDLIQTVEQSNFALKNSILKKLHLCKLE